MNIPSIISIIISVLALIINTALWITAYLNLKAINKQSTKMYDTMQSEAIYNIVQSHQTVYLNIIQNEKFIKLITDDVDIEISNTIGTLMINHCWSVYSYASKGFINDSTFLGMENDIAEIFEIPMVHARWMRVKRYYSKEFQNFIENVTEKGQRLTLKNVIPK